MDNFCIKICRLAPIGERNPRAGHHGDKHRPEQLLLHPAQQEDAPEVGPILIVNFDAITHYRRPNEQPMDAARGFRKPNPQCIVQLLSDSTIAADGGIKCFRYQLFICLVRMMCGNSGGGSPIKIPISCSASLDHTSNNAQQRTGGGIQLTRINSGDYSGEERQRKVSFDSNRLVYDGKKYLLFF